MGESDEQGLAADGALRPRDRRDFEAWLRPERPGDLLVRRR